MVTGRAGCWPDPVVLNSCWREGSTDQQKRAADVAASILWYGTGGQFDLCPVVLRPCTRCMCGCREWFPTAYIQDGLWRNGINCAGCRDWCCGVDEVILPSNAYDVYRVNIGGQDLVPGDDYRLDNYRRLVHVNAESWWPHCQDMDAPVGAPNTFTVEYAQSRLDAAGMSAYATLASELLAAEVAPSKCRLPQGITAVSREGITIDFTVLGELASRTGIVEVDLWLRMVNPAGLASAHSIVISPDTMRRPRGRSTTWEG
jgi:hypothetical protein